MKTLDRRQVAGWLAAGISLVITCLWAVWGIIENFHEGWYHESLLSNVGLMFIQYLSPMLIFMGLTVVSIFYPRLGGALHVIVAGLMAWFFRALTGTVVFLLVLPLVGLGALYWFGRPPPRRTALTLAVGLPVLTVLIFGIEPVLRVSQRVDDGIRAARVVRGNGLTLTWAPQGPGWPPTGVPWEEARRACQHLSEDGLTLAPAPQDIWRLPAVEDAVRSMARRSQNCGGVWDAEAGKATYQTTPDKESPLWDVHSQVIYWWTATEINEAQSYIIAYNGKVWAREKQFGPDYLGYRCVK